MGKNTSYKAYNAIDVLKLILAILVVVIHSGVDKTVISPVLRTAVPLFFIISSYFFFRKNKELQSKQQKNHALLRLLKRNLMLYLFWAVIQLPIVMYARGYYQGLSPNGLWHALRDILMGSGFTGAWYIPALAVGIAVVFWAGEKIPSIWLVILTLPLYIVCCLLTNYYNLFDANGIVLKIGEGYRTLTGGLYIYTGFPVALFWVSVGKVLAEKKCTVKTAVLWIVTGVSGALLVWERYAVVRWGLSITDDCYFGLILLCPVVFLLVSRSKLVLHTQFRIREMSVLIYVTHGCCGRIVAFVLNRIPDFWGQAYVKVGLMFLLSVGIGQIVIYLREKRNIKILKYAY